MSRYKELVKAQKAEITRLYGHIDRGTQAERDLIWRLLIACEMPMSAVCDLLAITSRKAKESAKQFHLERISDSPVNNISDMRSCWNSINQKANIIKNAATVEEPEELAPLPEWAFKKYSGFKIMSCLFTKDGRATGNAIIYDITVSDSGKRIYHTITDAGDTASYIESELNKRFHHPEYIAKKHLNRLNGEKVGSMLRRNYLSLFSKNKLSTKDLVP